MKFFDHPDYAGPAMRDGKFDRRHYKGGDGGAGQLRADEAARQGKIQAAVDTINQQFGSGPAMAAPSRDQFNIAGSPAVAAQAGGYQDVGRNDRSYVAPVAGTAATAAGFDQAGYDAAMGKFNTGNGAAGARQAMYDDLASATTDVAKVGLDRQFNTASKNNLFGLARSGLLGGSVDAESGADLSQRYGEGQIKATQAGIGAASDLKSTDERTRQNLISLAQSGIDTGTAASLAASQTAAAAQAAKSAIPSATVGDLFGDLGQAYLFNQQAQGRYPNGTGQVAPSGPSFGNLFTGKNYSGTVTG